MKQPEYPCNYRSDTDTWYMVVPHSLPVAQLENARKELLLVESARYHEARGKGHFDHAEYFKKRGKALFEGRLEQVIVAKPGEDIRAFQSTERMHPGKAWSFPLVSYDRGPVVIVGGK